MERPSRRRESAKKKRKAILTAQHMIIQIQDANLASSKESIQTHLKYAVKVLAINQTSWSINEPIPAAVPLNAASAPNALLRVEIFKNT